jgi:uncharacterized OB-fold protein
VDICRKKYTLFVTSIIGVNMVTKCPNCGKCYIETDGLKCPFCGKEPGEAIDLPEGFEGLFGWGGKK